MKSAALNRRFHSCYDQHLNLIPFTITSSISMLTIKYKLNIFHFFIWLSEKIIQNRIFSKPSQEFW
ncbi:hypothetical protein ACY61_02005 [Salmonella enterica subsp. enterica serovar Saintpaul]|uniref:Uncharacterized protein n=10 Tax=Salmonella enterica TaxID=28901 RepID=A0A5V9N4P5_SALET|nr:hypothetical protein LFZ46_13670 [Salmonella enterica subsp. enterica serovar Yovokome str. S-1850]ASO37368.1 hypothetical protein CHC80_08815 [Salmonella enterica subsp. enterica serovar Saintpaul]ASO49721.1 hypothetical protein CHD73_22320 [Salmonella enterica subsp. enterica serovar Manhattan]ATI91270.1 hypothetical protein CGA23_14780 [Salmonella enterica subsp. enterica]AVU70081.1 hypothetical protein FORC58_1130 [Salmonella enterica subsp. enterica serovar Typhimurium]AXD37348.1 hypot